MFPALALAATGAIFLALLLLAPKREKIVAVGSCAVLTLTAVVPISYSGDSDILKAGVVAAQAIIVATVVVRRPRLTERRWGSWLLFTYYGLSLLVTLSMGASLPALANAGLPALGILLLVLRATPAEKKIIVKWFIALALMQSVYAVAEVAGLVPKLWHNSADYPHQIVSSLIRAEGTFAQPLVLALFLLVALAFTLAGMSDAAGARKALIVVALFAGVFATGSRSALVLGILFTLFSLGGRAFERITVGLLALLLGATGLAAFGFFSSSVVANFLTGSSVSHRTGALDAIPRLLTQGPLNVLLGNGAGSSRGLFDAGLLQAGGFYAVDNQFVLSLVEVGVIGLLLLVSVILRGLAVGQGLRLPLTAVVTFFFTFDVLAWPSGAVLFALVLGMAFTGHPRGGAAKPRHVEESPGESKLTGKPSPAIAAVHLASSSRL